MPCPARLAESPAGDSARATGPAPPGTERSRRVRRTGRLRPGRHRPRHLRPAVRRVHQPRRTRQGPGRGARRWRPRPPRPLRPAPGPAGRTGRPRGRREGRLRAARGTGEGDGAGRAVRAGKPGDSRTLGSRLPVLPGLPGRPQFPGFPRPPDALGLPGLPGSPGPCGVHRRLMRLGEVFLGLQPGQELRSLPPPAGVTAQGALHARPLDVHYVLASVLVPPADLARGHRRHGGLLTGGGKSRPVCTSRTIGRGTFHRTFTHRPPRRQRTGSARSTTALSKVPALATDPFSRFTWYSRWAPPTRRVA